MRFPVKKCSSINNFYQNYLNEYIRLMQSLNLGILEKISNLLISTFEKKINFLYVGMVVRQL